MAITKKPAKSAEEAFISGAPDAAAAAPRRVRKGNKVQISLTITEPMLARVDDLASRLGQSRAAVINLAVMQMLQSGLRVDSE